MHLWPRPPKEARTTADRYPKSGISRDGAHRETTSEIKVVFLKEAWPVLSKPKIYVVNKKEKNKWVSPILYNSSPLFHFLSFFFFYPF